MVWLFLILFCVTANITTVSVSSLDTLKQGDFLNSSNHLVSANKLFTLGFYNPPKYPNDFYLAIWFTNDTWEEASNHPVWIGNRDRPFHNESVVLVVDGKMGELIIESKGEEDGIIKLYSGQMSSNTSATLLDSGNFILREINSGTEEWLWESFDYPADTLLPGMKLGINHRTGRNWTLNSWFSDSMPAYGAFSLEWDPSGRRLVVRRRGVAYWNSGKLINENAFSEFVHTDSENVNYKFINITNGDEEYFTYILVPTAREVKSRNNVSGWMIDYRGRILDQGRPFPSPQVELCYGYNTSGGCELWEQPKCRNNHPTFDLRSGSFYKPSGLFDFGFDDNNSSLSFSDCRDKCWKDCDCVGFMNYGDPGCLFYRGKSKFELDYRGAVVAKYVLISSSVPDGRGKKLVQIVTPVMVSLVLVLIGILCYLRRKTRQGKKKELLELMTLDGYTEAFALKNDEKKGQDLEVFSYSCIKVATESFSAKNKLGEGGFGPVYKGKLPNGQDIAVKKLSRKSGQGLLEFKTELILIAKLQHTNLVRLFGYCIQRNEKMLIYEYMPNKSLDFFLFDPTNKETLDWMKRFNIIQGIAQGLLYLHCYSRLRIVHRDLKASNILLDENMNPKISDFGTARIFKQNTLEANTVKIAGTRGYMAPEYIKEGIFSEKSDVYSFGVLMLEIVSSRKNNCFYDDIENPLNLVAYAWELWNRDATIELIDPALGDSCIIPDQLLRCIHIGLLCVQHDAVDRPTMSDVVNMLSDDSSALPTPKSPAFWTGDSLIEKGPQENLSAHGLSISEIDGR